MDCSASQRNRTSHVNRSLEDAADLAKQRASVFLSRMVGEEQSSRFVELRRAMVDSDLVRRGIRDSRVITAMARVPREEFVAEDYRDQAYEDRPLPIGEGQTISQPFIVAVSLTALSLQGGETILEIGTGSGYQTALLSELGRKVFSVERLARLAQGAQEALVRMGYRNFEISVGDGSRGWPEHAPFEAIVVSAAAPQIPEALFDQLAEGGRMVIPVGPSEAQDLQLVRKFHAEPAISSLNACRFVPLVGQQGYKDGW